MSKVPSTSSSSELSYLHSIYRFVDKPASDDQTKDSINRIINLFKQFQSTLSSCDHASMFQLNNLELQALQSSMTQMSSVRWYPNYASAILTLGSSIQGYADIALVGCDQWKFSKRLFTPLGVKKQITSNSCAEILDLMSQLIVLYM